mmetsp:Transcript_10309/g.21679  ORF Transcript_10309/g.21679 Transcript_10309/m.21679 type:complete len:133 (-) Transcript_10309:627-1025(-)
MGTQEGMETSRETLAVHETRSRFSGVVQMPCRHLTSRCPDRCNHGGAVAVFDVEEYVRYEKPGHYGDAEAKKFHVKLNDPCQPKDAIVLLESLKGGEKVQLNWNHDYVTRTYENGGSSKSPERPVTLLEVVE